MDTAPGIRDRITYANFGGSSYKSREVSESFRLLNLAKIIRTVYPTTDLQPPLSDEIKRKPKIQFLDTGIMNYAAGIQDEMLAIKDLNSLYKGYIVNHMANQELIAQQDNVRYKLHFWLRENANANAEVDIAIRYMQHIIPVEVKSGAQGRLRSLHEFIDRVDHSLGIRLLANRVKVESSKTRTNKQFTLLNLPYFLVSKLSDYIEWVNEKYELGLE
jgi:predicted AAA+ superfamily ATPase